MKHVSLFSGVAGFSLACDWITLVLSSNTTLRSGLSRDSRRRSGQESTDRLLESESRIITHPDRSGSGTSGSTPNGIGQKEGEVNGQFPQPESGGQGSDAPHPSQQGLQREQPGEPLRLPRLIDKIRGNEVPDWQENWYEVATRFCRVDDAVPNRVYRLKSLGNAIVPGVAYQIIKAIYQSEGVI